MTGKPVLVASACENVLFPDPALPVTMTRRPTADGASLIAVSVPHVQLWGKGKVAASPPSGHPGLPPVMPAGRRCCEPRSAHPLR